jgi:D-amino-acid dehydrogenase
MSLASRTWFEHFAAATGNPFALEKHGLFNVCRTPEGFEHESHVAALAQKLGMAAQVLDARQTAEREPGLTMTIVGSVYFPIDCHLLPRKLITALVAELKRLKVDLRWNTAVTGWSVEGSRIRGVRTTAGEIAADEFVLACGVWSPEMTKGLGIRLPMQAGKGYSLTLPRPRQRPTASVVCVESRIAVTPLGEALRFGGTMELSGTNTLVRPERVRQIMTSVPRYFPEFREEDFKAVEPWVGLRPVSPDGLPYVGRFRRHDNLIAACGHAMLGLSLGGVTATMVSEIISGRKTSLPAELLNPDRYG